MTASVIDVRLVLRREAFTLDVALALPARGVTALWGPSGCGKTTLLRAVAGLERAEGRVAIGDEVWQDSAAGVFVPTHRRAIGYVIQEAALFAHLSVRANLAYGRRRAGAAAARVALEPVVERLGIGALLDRRPATLSGGERQRVAIARALATGPRLLLMDEPLAALDARRKAEVLPYLDRLGVELGIPTLYVSHAVDEVARLADHVVLLDAGRLRAEGRVADVMARLDVPLAFGDDAGVVLDGVVGARDGRWHLARLDVGGGAVGVEPVSFWARDQGLAEGRRVRVRVLARDVSLARSPLEGSSIGNQLRATVEAVADDAHPALALVRVRAGVTAGVTASVTPRVGAGAAGNEEGGESCEGVPIVARLTRRSLAALDIAPGRAVWAQVKTVALME
jgi:molybdate transport system ATP-binding protein